MSDEWRLNSSWIIVFIILSDINQDLYQNGDQHSFCNYPAYFVTERSVRFEFQWSYLMHYEAIAEHAGDVNNPSTLSPRLEWNCKSAFEVGESGWILGIHWLGWGLVVGVSLIVWFALVSEVSKQIGDIISKISIYLSIDLRISLGQCSGQD